MFGRYTKAIWTFLTIASIAVAAILAATQAGVNLGISPVAVAWVAVIGAIVGPTLTAFFPNANQANLQPGQVVVHQSQMIPGTIPAAKHQP